MSRPAPALIVLLILLAAPPATAADPGLFRAFEATLDSVDSATVALGAWCARRRLADPPVIHARRVAGDDKPADAEVRRLLAAGPDETISYRHVRLACGDHVLSDADNWYLPGRLTPDMNRRLEYTDEPFGAVVAPLSFHRRTLATERLYDPVAAGGVPPVVLRHRAVLVTPDGAPFSLVVESYAADVLN
jgi:hypothetical protein